MSRFSHEMVPVLVFGTVAVLGIFFHLLQGHFRKKSLEAVAAKFGGRVGSSIWSMPWLEFDVDGVRAELNFSSGRRPFTVVRWDFVPGGRLRVVPEGIFSWLQKAFGTQDINVGDIEFDRTFLIQGAEEKWVRTVLDRDTRASIVRLHDLARNTWGWGDARFTIEAGSGGVSVVFGRVLAGRRETLLHFVEDAIAVFKRIRTPGTEGVIILSAQQLAGQGNCPVCASPLGESPRFCTVCGTPHHRDCWDYLGGCAIYGCSRRRAA